MLIPVILSGGAGSRLWPVSREQHPKPFIRLADGESLLQKAFIRAAALPGVSDVLTVTNRDFYFKTEDEYKEVNVDGTRASFILETVGRNTAPAVAAAAIHVAQTYGDDATVLILTADHLIAKVDAFNESVDKAVELAATGRIVTFGIKPEAPETGYGYIEADGNDVKQFVEKPSLEVAEQYLADENYLWNSGMFCTQAGMLIDELKKFSPEVYDTVADCLKKSRKVESQEHQLVQIELDADSFQKAPDISIDYALMEKTSNAAVVACDIGWSDIGSWDAFSNLVENDPCGNNIVGEALLHDVNNCFIQSNERVVGAVGVSNLVIIDTPDALLVADKERSQEVKQIVNQLKLTGHEAYKLHTTVHRPWGTYTILEDASSFKIKRIVVKPGASLSLQMHHHRSEHWIVVSGMAEVENGDSKSLVNVNQSTYIPAGHKHRLSNPGIVELVLIEVQSGEYLGEDDIVRFDDVYGRA